jgi:tetratricopeptide (TPR) repeat protein
MIFHRRTLAGLLAALLGLGSVATQTAPAPAGSAPATPPAAPPPPETEALLKNPFQDPALVDRLIEQSAQHYFKHEYVEAMRALETALQFAPGEAQDALQAALAQQSAGDAAGALLAFREAFGRFPQFVNIFTGLGFVRNETNDYFSAIRDFSVAIDLLPVAYLAYSGRAEAKIGLDDYAGAIEDFSVQIRAEHPASLERVYLKRGQAYLTLGDPAAASADFAQAMRLAPQFAAPYLFQSYALKYLGHVDDALTKLDEAIKLEPDFAQAYSARSWTHQELGRSEQALADADKAVALLPDVPDFVLNRAMLRDLLDQPEAARADYEKAIILAEDKQSNVVWFYAKFHLDLLARRLDGRPNDAYLADALTWPDCWQKRIGLFLAGRINAESLLKDATQAQRRPERANQQCEAHYFIGMLALVTGDRATAQRALEACVATNDLQTVEFSMAKAQLGRLAADGATPPASQSK